MVMTSGPPESVTRSELRPPQPLLVYDGDCGFCRFWVARWQNAVGDRVRFAPSQEVAAERPEVPPEQFSRAVQLIQPDGSYSSGAEAVFRALAHAPDGGGMLWLYQRFPGFAWASEAGYRVVAANRSFFSRLTRLFLGRDPRPSSYALSRWLFLRLLGLVYFVAFLSLSSQVTGLIGAHGILPARNLLHQAANEFGPERLYMFPTLAWLDSSDWFLRLLTEGGAALSALVVLDLFAAPTLLGLWVMYLSIVTIGGDFLRFQWDILLLEAGFLAIFFAPWRPLSAVWRHQRENARAERPPSRTMLWLLRWLLFRLLFLSGAVKYLSDQNWRNLTALDYHYWTQPLPTTVAWYAAQLPEGFERASAAGVFVAELAVPFLIFFPRRLRLCGAALAGGFQMLIALTGNYCFFNLLAMALCILLLDDAALRRICPSRLAARIAGVAPQRPASRLRRTAMGALAAVLFLSTGARMAQRLGAAEWIPDVADRALGALEPFYIANNYGLFAVMTTSRLEIQVEGSNDGVTWLPYEFKYKPGDLRRAPRWAQPFQPRLDWQMWFAALGSYQEGPWFTNFMVRLLQGSPEVLSLLARNPFPGGPPRYVRAVAYDYHFTTFAERRATGAWWRRDLKGLYFPVATLRGH